MTSNVNIYVRMTVALLEEIPNKQDWSRTGKELNQITTRQIKITFGHKLK